MARKRGIERLTGPEQAEIIKRGGYVYLSARDLIRALGPPDDLLAALQSGEIDAYWVKGIADPLLRSDDVIKWMAKHNRFPAERRH